MPSLLKVFLTCLLVFAVSACGGSSGGSSAPPTEASTDATLSALVLSEGAITPVFASGTTSYTLTVTSDSTTVTPTVNQADATVMVDGAAVASGAASASLALAVGDTAISIVVTAEDDSTTQTYTVTVTRSAPVASIELLDPTPGAGDQFGQYIVQLPNGNIVVNEPFDSTVSINSGAVHLYSPLSSTPIASLFGGSGNELLGVSGIIALDNSNYVVASKLSTTGGIFQSGSVWLIDGTTGALIGTPLTGDSSSDQLGSSGVFAVGVNNYVIASGIDDVGGIVNAGSVRLMDGSTGAQIGATMAGDVAEDRLGISGITSLGNNNYVVSSVNDSEGGLANAGTVRLVDGSTGVQIGPTAAADGANDLLGSNGITVLGNNNYVIVSQFDDEGGKVDAGSVRLVNGSTGVQIGATLAGDMAEDRLGSSGITVLGNNNYVIATDRDNEGGLSEAGSVRLVSGSTGLQVGATLAGSSNFELFGTSGITALGNSNFVIASGQALSMFGSGAVMLVDGSTGVQIGATLEGDSSSDHLGSDGAIALGNNNYVIISPQDRIGSKQSAGSVRLMDGSTGVQIGPTQLGDDAQDELGSGGITVLGNNNYVISSAGDKVGGIGGAGSVRLVSGTTGVQIGSTLAGDVFGDQLGSGGVTVLANNSFAIASPNEDEGGIVDGGTVRLVDGSTGAEIGAPIIGEVAGDMSAVQVFLRIGSSSSFILSQLLSDYAGLNSGRVRIVAP